MNKYDTISVQEVRRDPLGFLRQIKQGKKLTVIYHSKPVATVMSADSESAGHAAGTERLLKYAELARESAGSSVSGDKSYKELYGEDMSKKYGIS